MIFNIRVEGWDYYNEFGRTRNGKETGHPHQVIGSLSWIRFLDILLGSCPQVAYRVPAPQWMRVFSMRGVNNSFGDSFWTWVQPSPTDHYLK